jgi:hypothetical protein
MRQRVRAVSGWFAVIGGDGVLIGLTGTSSLPPIRAGWAKFVSVGSPFLIAQMLNGEGSPFNLNGEPSEVTSCDT